MDKRWKLLFLKNYKTSLTKAKSALDTLGFKKTFKVINVVGTNGKGSVSNYIAEGLESKSFKVGLFTSPHIWTANERIRINGYKISDEDFFKIYKLLPNDLHFFTYLTLVALKYFEEQNCDYVILEAGIGGLRDTTKIIEGNYGLVTSVALDHEKLLGNSLESIAQNKAGIMNQNMNFIVPTSLKKPLRAYFNEYSLVNNDGENYQIRNQKLASAALKKWFNIEFDNFIDPRARSEMFLHNGYKTYFDVAHNLEGITESLKIIGSDFNQVVISYKKDKTNIDFKNIFKNKIIHYYQPNDSFKSFDDFKKIDDINCFFKNQDQKTLYIGSFYLIGDIYEK